MNRVEPPRPRSHDDLGQVSALEAAEERARAALRLVEQEQVQKAELERKVLELKRQQELDEAVRQAQAKAPKVEAVPSQRPGVLTVQAKGLKLGIPLAILVPVLAAAWAGVQNYMDQQRQLKAAIQQISTLNTSIEKATTLANKALEENAKLTVTVAELSGYLVGVLPKAGVNVPGTGSPIQADPLPPGARRQTPVNVRTPVPTPGL